MNHPDGRLVAEIVVRRADGEYRGSGYLMTATCILTAAHLVADATGIEARFHVDERTVPAVLQWHDLAADLAVLAVAPQRPEPHGRYGRIGDKASFVQVQFAGFPSWKLRSRPDGSVFRESHHAGGTIATLSNRRTGTFEITVPRPADGDTLTSWEAISGAVVWAGGCAVGVVTRHYTDEGGGRLEAARLDRYLKHGSGRAALVAVLGPAAAPESLIDITQTTLADAATTAENPTSWAMLALTAVIAAAVVTGLIAMITSNAIPDRFADSPVRPATDRPSSGNSATSRSSPPAPTTAAYAVDRIFLTDLPPAAGGSSVTRPVGTSGVLEMPCATADGVDRYRAVRYSLLKSYRSLQTHVTSGGAARSETKAQVEFIVDNIVVANRVLLRDQSADMDVSLTGKQTLELRLTCEEPAGKVTFERSYLTR
jgi:hypothetical protein